MLNQHRAAYLRLSLFQLSAIVRKVSARRSAQKGVTALAGWAPALRMRYMMKQTSYALARTRMSGVVVACSTLSATLPNAQRRNPL